MKISKALLIGCGGTIGLVIIILAISFIVFLNSEKSPPGDSSSSTPASATTPTSSATPPTTTAPPTATEQPVEEIGLIEAINQGLIELSITGRNTIDEIKIKITSTCSKHLSILIPPGIMFVAGAGVQNMVVTKLETILLEPGDSRTAYVDAACANMELDVPVSSDSFVLYTEAINADLKKLLELDGFSDYTFRIRQFAIWTITDNPKRHEYMGISSAGGWGTGPSDAEIETIKAIFQEAGISLTKYQALQ